tara:strand:- start:214 stop:843 length:630 start_codon:yes stop_codon:yes gene_type:complete
MMDHPIIVTGCQRSGTNITAHILGNSRQYLVLEDSDWMPTSEHIRTLKDLVDSGRNRLVIQSPSALNHFHFIHHLIPSLHWVGVKRDKKQIIASMERVKWFQDDYPDYLPFYNHHIRFMNSQWGLLKQLLPEDNWTEVLYPDELQDYPEFIPQNLRKDFTTHQTRLNEPKGPQYWLNDVKGWTEAAQTANQSSKIFNQEESSQNIEEIP